MNHEWLRRAPCRHYPDLWTTPAHQKDAVHICKQHCEVKDECAAAFAGVRLIEVVIVGQAYSIHGEPLEKLHGLGDVALHNPWCRAIEGRPQLVADRRSGARQQQKEA